jgi:hypothetical protein
MSKEEKVTREGNETYDLMITLERLESLREDLEEAGLRTLKDIEAALSLIAPNNNPSLQSKRRLLTDIRSEFLDLNLTSSESIQVQIDQINEQLDGLE